MTRRLSSGLRGPVGVVLLTCACQELPELRYQTEHLEIGTAFDAPLCRGDLEHFERIVTHTEDLLDTNVDSPIELYIWDPLADGRPRWCENEAALGCYRDGVVYTSVVAIDHELIHPVVASLAGPERFWDEGAAEALQTERTRLGATTPTSELESDGDAVNYNTAGHFSRWLIETRGIELFRALLIMPGGGRAVFEATYGLELGEAEAQYLAQAPHSYGAMIACEHPPLTMLEEATWSETITLDCAQADTYGGPQGLRTTRVFTVAARGDYALTISGEGGAISRCAHEDYELQPSLDQAEVYGDVPAYTDTWIHQYVRVLPGQATTVLDLAPGDYELVVASSVYEPQVVQVNIVQAP